MYNFLKMFNLDLIQGFLTYKLVRVMLAAYVEGNEYMAECSIRWVRTTSKKYEQHMYNEYKICTKYVQNMYKICTKKYVQKNMYKICTTSTKYVPNMYNEYKICTLSTNKVECSICWVSKTSTKYESKDWVIHSIMFSYSLDHFNCKREANESRSKCWKQGVMHFAATQYPAVGSSIQNTSITV